MPPKRARGRNPSSLGAAPSRLESQTTETESAPSTTAQANAEVASQISPNSSPADAPTETPAPTPVRAPVQRLESLSTRGGPSARGARAGAASSRFKPKAVRRGAEEREKAAREIEEKKRAKDKDAAREAREADRERGGRSRGRGMGTRGRGRGDAMGRGGLNRASVASGPFGMAPSGPDKRPGMFAPGSGPKLGGTSSGGAGGSGGSGGGRSAGGGITIKSEPVMSHYIGSGGGGGGSRIKTEVPEPVYPEEQEDGERAAPRVDIEHINLVTDDEGSEAEGGSHTRKSKGKGTSSKGGLKPVRLHREEHKERVTILNTEPAAAPGTAAEGVNAEEPVTKDGSNKEESRKAVPTASAVELPRKWRGAWKDAEDEEEEEEEEEEDEVLQNIKPDPETPAARISDVMEVDSASATPAVDADLSTGSQSAREHSQPQSPEGQKKKTKSRRKSGTKDRKPVLQTEEDKAEYARHLVDIQVLSDELGGLQTSRGVQSAVGDAEDDEEMENQVKDKEGRLYLFQFPPILPPLRNPVKKEEKREDVEMEDVDLSQVPEMDPSTANTGAGSSKKDGIDLTKSSGNDQEETIIKNEPGTFVIPAELITEEGFIGQLVVRESGKVELNWGGTSLQLGRGAEFEFLTTTLIVEEDQGGERGVVGNNGRRGVGTGMGRVMGKFVATPDWSRLF